MEIRRMKSLFFFFWALIILLSPGCKENIYQSPENPMPKISINDITIMRSGRDTLNFRFTVFLSEPSLNGVKIGYYVDTNYARNEFKVLTHPGDLTFAAYESSQSISVTTVIVGELHNEYSSFRVGLKNPINTVIVRDFGVGSILNDEDTLHFTVDLETPSGWSLVSTPPRLSIQQAIDPFQSKSGKAFTYRNQKYTPVDSMIPMDGYWIKMSKDETTSLLVQGLHVDSVIVDRGWNLVGSISYPFLVTQIKSNPSGIIEGRIFQEDKWGGLQSVDTLYPMKGYWVKSNNHGTLYFDTRSEYGENASRIVDVITTDQIRISDAVGYHQILYFSSELIGTLLSKSFELPPSPPQGIFDVRYSTGTMLEGSDGSSVRKIPIQISSAVYPVSLSWDCSRSIDGTYSLDAGSAHVELHGSGSIMISESNAAVVLNIKHSSR